MALKPGDIVVLKSGGPALTVAEINGENVECVWIGEDGELFREELPSIVLDAVEMDLSDEDEDEDDKEDEAA
jgi:uncharacterized protein YodC (DUF2158 family)